MKVSVVIAMFVLAMMVPFAASGYEALSDEQLHGITAGSFGGTAPGEEVIARIPFRYSLQKGQLEGEVMFVPVNTYDQFATLQLMDNAQSNLQSLVNINAVNSPVQVLMNLNVNVNSTVGRLNQWNQQLRW